MDSSRPAEQPARTRPQGDCRSVGALDKGLKKKRILGTISSHQFWVSL